MEIAAIVAAVVNGVLVPFAKGAGPQLVKEVGKEAVGIAQAIKRKVEGLFQDKDLTEVLDTFVLDTDDKAPVEDALTQLLENDAAAAAALSELIAKIDAVTKSEGTGDRWTVIQSGNVTSWGSSGSTRGHSAFGN